LSHVLVVVAVLLMVRLGFWQYSRWQEESDALDRIEAGLEADPVPLDQVAGADADLESVDQDVRWRRVSVTGTWDSGAEVLIRNRSQDGRPGGWLLTPLVQEDGTAVAVVRGWVPLEVANAGAPFDSAAPPEGPVTVVGAVGLTQTGGGLGPSDPDEGRLDSMARVDLARLAEQMDAPLEPVWVTLEASEPAPVADPGPAGAPFSVVELELPSPSQNFSYMVQWWVFATIAAVGYVLILRKVAHTRGDLTPRSGRDVDGGGTAAGEEERVDA
jgi:cytochrome oxidase assembly protein ShyY1